MYMKKRGKKKASAADPSDPSSPPPPVHHKASILDVDDFDHRLGDYQLMEGIGKGGYGLVYRGMNVATGMTVAVKRVQLAGVKDAELEAILMEIKLLEALSHPNIVKYLDSVTTSAHLCIILEFVENGALSSLLSKFGGYFPEPLVAHYIAQVLMGLQYLHQQGVIHRDIKGANILSTKEGNIKLADFGVATTLTDSRKSDSVVGTPYWMAPEIIEMSGQQSSACDIWSVGCTVLELLTGKPPYFDLQQMPALFRIVQDEHPPLPDGISGMLEDFLMKDPNRRIDAAGLLKHPWLKKEVEKERAKESNSRSRGVSNAVPDSKEQQPPTAVGKHAEVAEVKEQLVAAESKVQPRAEQKSQLEVGDDEDWDVDEDDDDEEPDLQSNPLALPTRSLAASADEDAFADFSDDDEQPLPLPSAPGAGHGAAAVGSSAVSMMVAGKDSNKAWKEWAEDDAAEEDEFGDMLDDDDDVGELQLVNKPHAAAGAADGQVSGEVKAEGAEEDDDVDPFDDIEFTDTALSEEDLLLNKTFMRIMALLSPEQSEHTICEQCEKLMSLYAKQKDKVTALMNKHAVIPIMELLTSTNANIIYALLKLINCVITSTHSFLQSLCLVGLIPAIIRFANPNTAASLLSSSASTISLPLLRLEAANFIRLFCYTSDYTRKMFIACDGLPVLISFLSLPAPTSSPPTLDHLTLQLVYNAIDCIRHIFDISTNPKNDFCRLFVKFHMLQPLIHVYQLLSTSSAGQQSGQQQQQQQAGQSKERSEYQVKIAQILLLFSQGDTVVKQQFAQPPLIAPILQLLPLLPPAPLLLTLKSLCNLSMDSSTLDSLEAAGAIPLLLPYLRPSNPLDCQQQTLLSMYYLTQIKASRQEQAGLNGIVPDLRRFIESDSPLKQFAYPILFQLAKTSRRVRVELKKQEMVSFYLHVVRSELYWRSAAIECLALWLSEDSARVGWMLCQPVHVNTLLEAFLTSANSGQQYEKLLMSFRKLVQSSVRLNQTLGHSATFIAAIKARLSAGSSNAVRVNLLNLLSLLLVAHTDALQMSEQYGLVQLLESLCEEKESVLVASLATKMLERLSAEREREEELNAIGEGKSGKKKK